MPDFKLLDTPCVSTARFVSDLVGNPEDRCSLGLFQKKIPGGGKTAGDIFFYGWSVRTFFKLYGSLVFDKF